MKQLPSRLRRLDGALADLPLDEPMLLTELDGFLTGVLLCPEPIASTEWMTVVWGSDEGGVAPFDDPLDVQWFADAVSARLGEIGRDLARGKPQPIFDTDERNGDILWEGWIDGFAEAMALRPDLWTAITDGDDPDAADTFFRLSVLIAVARDESALDSVEINTLQDRAPADLIDIVLRLHAARARIAAPPMTPVDARPTKVGRNDPCRCGSGRSPSAVAGDVSMAGEIARAWNAAEVRKWLESRVAAARSDQASAERAGRAGQDDCDKATAEEMVCSLMAGEKVASTQDTFADGLRALLERDDYVWRGVHDDVRFDRHVRSFVKKLIRMAKANAGFENTGRYQ